MSFYWLDNRIWFRNYQVTWSDDPATPDEHELAEIGEELSHQRADARTSPRLTPAGPAGRFRTALWCCLLAAAAFCFAVRQIPPTQIARSCNARASQR